MERVEFDRISNLLFSEGYIKKAKNRLGWVLSLKSVDLIDDYIKTNAKNSLVRVWEAVTEPFNFPYSKQQVFLNIVLCEWEDCTSGFEFVWTLQLKRKDTWFTTKSLIARLVATNNIRYKVVAKLALEKKPKIKKAKEARPIVLVRKKPKVESPAVQSEVKEKFIKKSAEYLWEEDWTEQLVVNQFVSLPVECVIQQSNVPCLLE